jgi:dihydrofolate reductase
VSSTLTEPGWQNSTVLSGDMAAEVQALKERPGGDIVTTGSMQLAQSLIAAGLVDEYRLFVYPVVLGTGIRLFEAANVGELALLEVRPFRSGVLLLTYRPATPAS